MNLVSVYSLAKDGETKLSKNFRVEEFACKDGSDPVFISPRLVYILQAIRDNFGKSVNVNSAYRTPTHNATVGGDPNSNHMWGMAADIWIPGVSPKEVAAYAELLMPDWGGIGIYNNFVHIGVQAQKTRWVSR